MGSFKQEQRKTFLAVTAFDPFGGSGTVGIAAEELGRRSVITEISLEYCRMARERIDKQQPSLSLMEDVR